MEKQKKNTIIIHEDLQSNKIIEVDTKKCKKWQFSNRTDSEFYKIDELAKDIMSNGQISPILIRETEDPNYDYEVIAGARRWKACSICNIPVKAILTKYNDKEAAIAQIKENAKHEASNYSKGFAYARLLKSKIIEQRQLADSLGISRSKLQALLWSQSFFLCKY